MDVNKMTPELERLRNMQYLDNTENWMVATRGRGVISSGWLERCKERDVLQASRPEGCFCLRAGKMFARVGVAEELCGCPEGIVLQALEKTKEDGLRADRYTKTWERCGVPRRFLECRLRTSPLDRDLLDKVAPISLNKDCGLEMGGDSWFLHGASGVGKTGLAVGWLYERLQAGNSVLFTTVPDLLGEIKATYGGQSIRGAHEYTSATEEDVIQKYLTVDSLVLDDLGAEQIGNEDWLQDRLYRIIGGRHDELRPTVATSNPDMEAAGRRLGNTITWRLVEMCGKENIICIEGRNLREE